MNTGIMIPCAKCGTTDGTQRTYLNGSQKGLCPDCAAEENKNVNSGDFWMGFQAGSIMSKLDRIEEKLDRLLERKE